jgi:hypothetical protein
MRQSIETFFKTNLKTDLMQEFKYLSLRLYTCGRLWIFGTTQVLQQLDTNVSLEHNAKDLSEREHSNT